jgi:hypothetical protein
VFWVFGMGLGVPACPPAYRGGLFGGQSGEVVWDASISFGFLGVCSFAVFPSGYENTTAPLSSKSRR